MEEEFVPLYALALDLKDLGFDKPCFATIDQTDYLHINGAKRLPRGSMMYDAINCPTFSQAFRWFRKKNIQSTIQEYDFNNYMYLIDDGINRDIEAMGYNTYEEAELECLKKLIEIVKNRDYENLFYTIDR
jgi:hypothetical protein